MDGAVSNARHRTPFLSGSRAADSPGGVQGARGRDGDDAACAAGTDIDLELWAVWSFGRSSGWWICSGRCMAEAWLWLGRESDG